MSATSKLFYMLKKNPAMQTPTYKKLITEAESELTSAINYFNKHAYNEGHSDQVEICEQLLGKREGSYLKRKGGKNWTDPEYNDGFRYDDKEEK